MVISPLSKLKRKSRNRQRLAVWCRLATLPLMRQAGTNERMVDIMKILLEKLQKLERMEEIANHAEADYDREPENAEYEATFDLAYQNEFNAYIEAAKYIEYMTNGNIDFITAKKMILTKREELISILSA